MPKRNLQTFEIETVKRSRIKEHPSNPRLMTAEARKKLERGLDKFGLLEPLIVNKRTGHVLGGNQRLAWLDKKHSDKDYELQVAWCDIPEEKELTVVALLNQPNAQGDWDLDKLKIQIEDSKLDIELAGFERLDLEMFYPDADFSGLFSDVPQVVEKTASELKKLRDETHEQFVKDRKNEREAKGRKEDSEFYIVVVFGDRGAKESFLARLKLPADERYIAASNLESYLPKEQKRVVKKDTQGKTKKSASSQKSGTTG
jgi:hypothetical protein